MSEFDLRPRHFEEEQSMHSYYAFLALDVARERAQEAERLYLLRHGTDGRRASSRLVRRLVDAVRGAWSLVAGQPAVGPGTSGRLATGGKH